MIELLLKASVAVGIAFLFYKLLLQQESFFTANRLYLVGCLALAFALPFVNLPKLVSHQGYLATLVRQSPPLWQQQPVTTEASMATVQRASDYTQVTNETATAASASVTEQPAANKPAVTVEAATVYTWADWVLYLYLFGAAVFALSLLYQLGSILYKVITATDKVQDGKFTIINLPTKQAPCSFFNYIFIHPDAYDFETYEQIIAHEKIHATLGHSFDLLLAELAVVLLWFNPFSWYLKREIEKNNEYQTDALLLEKDQVSKKKYQLNLLQIAVPNKPLSITTNYNQSLLKQRIMMMNAKKSLPHAYWKYAFMLPLFFGLLLLMNEPASSQHAGQSYTQTGPETVPAPAQAPAPDVAAPAVMPVPANPSVTGPAGKAEPATEPMKATVGPENETVRDIRKPSAKGVTRNIIRQDRDMSQGYWYSSKEGNEYCLQFKGDKNTNSWNMSRCFAVSAFQKNGTDVYELNREAGTLRLSGDLGAEVGQGKYTFTEDENFRKYLASNNISSNNKNLLFHLFFGDVTKKYVDFLKKNYADISGDRLLELAIHGVTQQRFQNYLALFEKYSNKKPTLQEVVAAQIHGINEDYVKQLQNAGYTNLSMSKLTEAKIHGVSDDYVKQLREAGFSNLPIDKVIEAKIHGVNANAIKELQALGYGNLPLNKIIELRIHRVDAAHVQGLKEAGYPNLPLEKVVSAKIHGLTPAAIKELKALGYKNLEFDELISAKIHGVNAAYVEDLKKAGFPNLSMDETISAKIHGINSDFIAQARQDGYDLNSIDKYISLKIHGMAIKSLKEKDKVKNK